MKRRAGVWKGASGRWWVDVRRAEDWDPEQGIAQQGGAVLNPRHPGCATHAEALAHALAEVGLDRPIEHREAP
ncbi:hypothetical protein [Brachybacterium sp. SW0106-09]|uniref:hypothetical protein n=1 Tax=Brachybacterium sp. SW0106-09 TaxID=1704590 RepID=UPI0006B62268|nr:hypothetical protein [Brachybacterium sp. SW0106-09]